jgi:hypothetical protein
VLGALAVLAALGGCTGMVTRKAEGFSRAARSVTIGFAVPDTIKVIRHGSGGIPAAAMERARDDVRKMLQGASQQLRAALDARRVPVGDDVQLKLQVEEAWHNENGPGADVTVLAYFKDAPAGSTPWTFRFRSGSHIGSNADETANKLATMVLGEAVKAGIVPDR